jgi:hypothetical protein
VAWYSTFEAAAVALVGAIGVAVGTAFKFRRSWAKDNSEIAQLKVDSRLGAGLLATLISERDAANAGRDAANKVVHEVLEMRTADARTIARLEARVAAFEERAAEHDLEREKKYGACEERVRALAERVLDLQMANGRVFAELARANPAAAERLLQLQIRPVPPGPGDEPP